MESAAVDLCLSTQAAYRLASGREGSVLAEQVLDYNQDPGYLRDLLLYRLTVEAQKAVEDSPLYRKSVDKLLFLLQVLDREVDLVVREKRVTPARSR